MAIAPHWRRWFTFFLIALAAASLAAVACTPDNSFLGTELAPTPAANFRLHDQFGQAVVMSDLRGKVVVLSFLYTRCPDVCPLTAGELRLAYEALGGDASQTAFLVVSVDPAGDTQAQAYLYSEEKGMLNRWSYLTGSREELEPVWQAYYVAVEPGVAPSGEATPQPHQEEASQGPVGHSAPVYLIDQLGNLMAVFTHAPPDHRVLAHDIRLLLR